LGGHGDEEKGVKDNIQPAVEGNSGTRPEKKLRLAKRYLLLFVLL